MNKGSDWGKKLYDEKDNWWESQLIRKFIDEKVNSGLWRQTSLLMDGQTTLVVKLLLQPKDRAENENGIKGG